MPECPYRASTKQEVILIIDGLDPRYELAGMTNKFHGRLSMVYGPWSVVYGPMDGAILAPDAKP